MRMGVYRMMAFSSDPSLMGRICSVLRAGVAGLRPLMPYEVARTATSPQCGRRREVVGDALIEWRHPCVRYTQPSQ